MLFTSVRWFLFKDKIVFLHIYIVYKLSTPIMIRYMHTMGQGEGWNNKDEMTTFLGKVKNNEIL